MILASARHNRYVTTKIQSAVKNYARFLADAEAFLPFANNLVEKHFSRCKFYHFNKK